jgi:AbiV family abortive infection protein
VSNDNVNLDKFARIAELSLKNALRLHYDAIYLFNRRSYPSAYFLSILSLEEIGKMLILDDFVYYSLMNEAAEGSHLDEFTKSLLNNLYTHQRKQAAFVSQGINLPPHARPFANTFLKTLESGRLEKDKQNSVYVGLERRKSKVDLKGKIRSPWHIRRDKAKRQITTINDSLIELSLGIVEEVYSLDIPLVEQHLNENLVSKLQKRWKYMRGATKRRCAEFQSRSQ